MTLFDEDLVFAAKGIALSMISIVALLGIIWGSSAIYADYSGWYAKKMGEAQLIQANYSRQANKICEKD